MYRKNTLKHFCENIQVGDVLTSVNGQSTMDIPTDELYQTLRGHAKGSRFENECNICTVICVIEYYV